MAAPAAAAEEAPVLVGLYMTLEAVLTWLLERALLLIWIFTIGALLTALGNLLTYDKYFVHIHWGGPFFRLERDIHAWIGRQVQLQEFAIGWWWHQTARIQGWIAHETWGWAKDLYHWGGWLVHTYVPTYVHGLTDTLHVVTRTTTKQVTVVEHKTIAIERDVVIPHAGELGWIHRHWRELTKVVAAAGAIAAFPPLAIPKIWHGIDELRESLRNILKRLRRVESLFAVGVFAAVLAETLGVSARCVRSGGPVGKVARRLCGLSSEGLNNILGLLVDLVILEDICQVIVLLEDGLSLIETPLNDFIGGIEAALCHGDYDRPPTLTGPALSLPPVTGINLSLAA